ncbi:MAG TPA: iron-siderophore ABC transporter substrate-binding protein [Nostocaceae cyanobacterium]|nr:iron-siderophore ABC transporter substrate-binding protein [Nostocaceae cyanobacterium]
MLIVTSCHSIDHQNLSLNKSRLSTNECQLVKHDLGETCVDVNPQRIIVTDQTTLEVVLALGLKPIATPVPSFVGNKASFLGDKMTGITYIGKENQLNIEKMVYLHPDLIIGLYDISPENYKLFSQIAPTVKVSYIQYNWQTSLKEIAKILGKTEQAEKLIQEYQTKITNLKTTLGDKLKNIKVSIGRFHGQVQSAEFRSQFSFPGSILTEIGVSFPEQQLELVKNPNNNLIQVSLERLDLLDADIFFVAVDPGAIGLFQKYQQHELWKQLKVFQNQKIYNVDSSYWLFGNILSANAILDDLFKYLPNLTVRFR